MHLVGFHKCSILVWDLLLLLLVHLFIHAQSMYINSHFGSHGNNALSLDIMVLMLTLDALVYDLSF